MSVSRLTMLGAVLLSCMPAFAVTYQVRPGESLQSYIDRAAPFDIIELPAGATFTGNFVLKQKPTSGRIHIRSSRAAYLPARVSPADAPNMTKIVTTRDLPAISTEARAKGYVLTGLEITVSPGMYAWSLVALGNGDARSLSELPNDITISKCYIHGDPRTGGKNGINLHLSYGYVNGSYISDIKSTFQDAHAILGFNGPGPFFIENNYLEASGENIMFGGARAGIPNIIPSDIQIRNNILRKPLSWKVGSPTYAGAPWVVKNHLELKNAQRVTIDRNVFENCWAQGQSGASILLTVRTEEGTMPWAVVQDVQITNNLIRSVAIGILTHSKEWYGGIGRRWTIRNNIFEDVQASYGASLGGTLLALAGNTEGVIFERNTGFASKYTVYMGEVPTKSLVYNNNITTGDFCGDGLGCNSTLVGYTGQTVAGNLFIGQLQYGLPLGNKWSADMPTVRFIKPATSDYRLLADSPFVRTATNGTNPGSTLDASTLPR